MVYIYNLCRTLIKISAVNHNSLCLQSGETMNYLGKLLGHHFAKLDTLIFWQNYQKKFLILT